MTVSIRSYLSAGMAAMVAGSVAIAPIQPLAPASVTVDAVRLSAAVQPLVNQVNAAAATLGQNAPTAAVQQPLAQKSAQANNNVSDAIDAVYGAIMYWADYWALELGPYLLGWVPFGYLISDQLYIWYPNFTVPVSASFVYDFLDPVVNDFWNFNVWRDGLTALANTTRVQLGVVTQQEIAYVFSLAWFPFPLPPLPPIFGFKVPAGAANSAAAAEKTTTTTKSSGTGHSARPQATKQDPDTTDATDTTDTTGDTVVVAAASTPTAAKTPKAGAGTSSPKSGSAKSGTDSGPKKSTGGSARSHGPKANKSAD
ncbi:hypothetical protein FHT40_005441 [Mycolicibacterium sp. BK556]|uniref:hypothetical protein n=1 Tax=unclassified Mycolicibacterium TaxID=2636767 RepID=UPI0016104842|nr:MULTISPECIES: hypothetical protein [unclassified Mycolicibacterium]MBB3605754.1 hypothetical protein [Mycolicibacterium sp. BK556]MBB3635749.1 hypothetical protein [Mycolicibacterium sp. BK607]